MSLQGSFETIALRDVMALLASSHKSGELRVVGGQVEGRLWLQEGCLVASKVGKAHGYVDALFELLRLTEGNFVFKDGVEAPAPEEATPVEPVVRQAEERLKVWDDIERTVPSLDHRVRLIPDLPTPEVTLSADDWRLVMATALAGTVVGVLEELGLGHFDGCRGLKRLVDAGLVIVDPPRVRPSASDPGRLARRVAAVDGSPIPSDGGGGPLLVFPDPAALSPGEALVDAGLGAAASGPVGLDSLSPWPPPALAAAAEGSQATEENPRGTLGSVASVGSLDSGVASLGSEIGSVGFEVGLVGSDVGSVGFEVGSVAPIAPVASVGSIDSEIGSLGSVGSVDESTSPFHVVGPSRRRTLSPRDDDLVVVRPGPDRDESDRPESPRARAELPALPTNGSPVAPGSGAQPEERDNGGDSINRGLLLKFLSSVRS